MSPRARQMGAGSWLLGVALAVGGCGATTPADAPAAAPLALAAPAAPAPETGPRCAAPAPPEAWYRRAIGYEIFVRSFADSDGDGIGDLAGLTSHLDYLNDGDPATDGDLGVDLLWLMPINESPSYHGYDVTDYREVEPDYGTLADLDALIAAAKARGIRIVTDLVVNHTSRQHPWFGPPGSPHGDWYVWADAYQDWQRPWGGGPVWHRDAASGEWFYALFWDGMPDLDWANPAVEREMIAIAKTWLGRGLAGFRLDAARYLIETGGGAGQADTPETHAAWRRFRAEVAAEYPEALLLGEIWTDTAIVATYFGSAGAPELHMNFDFDTASAIESSVANREAVSLERALCARLAAYPAHGAAGTFVANHDQVRVATAIAGAGLPGLKLAAAVLLTLPGTPWLYYGEEIGMENGTGGDDIAKRLPMQWAEGPGVGFTTGTPWAPPRRTERAASVAGQLGDPASLLSTYRRLIRLRRAIPALARGSVAQITAQASRGGVVALARTADGAPDVVLVFNFRPEANDVTLAAAELPVAGLRFVDRWGGQTYTRADADAPLKLRGLPATSFAILTSAEPALPREESGAGR